MTGKWIIAFAAVVFAVAPISAQTVNIDEQREQQRRSQEDLERAVRAEERARLQRILDSNGEVTYADVLKDPDNIPLNLRYAQTQIRDGNIRGASATLERILLLDPDRPDVRLLYAVVLFRLDNLQDAERELLAVRDLPMSDSLRQEVDSFLDQIQQRRKRLRFSLLVNFGLQYDWNGNTAPDSSTRLVSDTPFTLNDADQRHREFTTTGTVRLAAEYDLGLQRRHSVNSAATLYRAEHLHEDQLDLEFGGIEAGAMLAYEPVTIDPSLSIQKIRLAHYRYLTLTRFETETAYQVTKKSALTATLGWEDQHYSSLPVSTTANAKEGRQWDVELGFSSLLASNFKFASHLRYYDKNAKRPYNAYRRYEAGAAGTVLLSGGRFVIGSVTYQQDSYQRPDTFISSRLTRQDWSVRAKVLFGFPISNLFEDELASFFEGLTGTVSLERYLAVSNLPDYDYRNTSIGVGLTRKWSF